MKRLILFAGALLCVSTVLAAAKTAPKRSTAKTQGAAVTKGATAKKAAAKTAQPSKAAVSQPPKGYIGKIPYIGAIAIDADTGRVLFEDNADTPGYPASTLKLMTLLVVTDMIEAGKVRTNDVCSVSVRAYKTGGSQVYLDPKESFPLEELLYALMIQSANDAAVAIAEHCAGSCEAFVELMNKRAEGLGMKNTRFQSVHGLPPNVKEGQRPDVSTARDMSCLCRELCLHPSIFRYTSASYRQFRAGTKRPFDMRTHNPFLKDGTPGCDGFKTGFTATAGWSIAVTAKRGDRRVIVYVLGAGPWSAPAGRKNRDAKAREILNRAFATE